MLNALTQDNEAGAEGGFVKGVMNVGASLMTDSTAMSISQATSEGGPVKPSLDYNPEDFDLEKLQEEKEGEIQQYVQQLQDSKKVIDDIEYSHQRDQ
mmetsp:Transcript_14564/g.22615  ORF Transcript_14564/g.22615 Transcript_14564/m.22615 type:complete len:97 (+) Transcript_14564:952-1242(+)